MSETATKDIVYGYIISSGQCMATNLSGYGTTELYGVICALQFKWPLIR